MPPAPPRPPSAAEKLDHAGRLTDELEEAGRHIRAARTLLRAGRAAGSVGLPMFPDVGKQIDEKLDTASLALYDARKQAGIQGFEAYRQVQEESVHDNPEGEPT